MALFRYFGVNHALGVISFNLQKMACFWIGN